MPGIFDPLIPQSTIRPMQQALESENWTDSELEAQLRGFGSGALEGLRNLSSPAQLASTASLFIPGMAAARPMAQAARAVGSMERAAPAVAALRSLPAEFTQAVPQVAARVGLPAELGPYARAAEDIVGGGLKATGDPWQIGRAAEQVGKYLGNIR